MKHCSFWCKGWWPFLLFPTLLLVPLLFFQWQAIEADVADNASQTLRNENIDWAKVITFKRGRDVLIAGTAPDQQAVATARQLVLSAQGVRAVQFTANNIAVSPARFSSIVTGDTVVIRGEVADQASIDSLLSQAKTAFGDSKVINKLSLGENVATLGDVDGLFTALASDGKLGTITAAVEGERVVLTGEVLSASVKNQIERQLAKVFGSRIDNQLQVVAPPDVCEDLVKELLASGEINFDSGAATIAADSYALLDQISGTAQSCPDARFEIAGHTDTTGNSAFNTALSQRRAEAVLGYLVDKGLPAEQFSAIGYGATEPIDSNDTEQGRANNRRIEFRLKN